MQLAAGLGIVVGVLIFYFFAGLGEGDERIEPEEVWNHVQNVASEADLDPEYVYALAWAESSLNAKAESSVARGMMQLTRSAWKEVSDESYRHAWDWKTNIEVAVDYLVFCRHFLENHNRFDYKLLAAAYRYGPYYVKRRNFDLNRIKKPKNEIYKRIFNGEIRPVAPPAEAL